jgi:hypothetical protein
MFLLFFIAGGALLLNYIKYFVIYNKFRDYLFSIDDKDTLRKIGRLNSLDQRTFANVPFTKVHKVLIEKYKQTNDEKYLLFDEQYMKCIKHIAILIASLFMIYVFYQILSYG